MELRELNNQGPLQVDAQATNNFDINHTKQQIQHQQQHLMNVNHQLLNRIDHSMATNMRNLGQQQQQQQHQQQQQQQQHNHQILYQCDSMNGTTNTKFSSKQHRELPVDVPDSFVGMAKQSPRYPPPKSNRQISPPMPINGSQFKTFSQATATSVPSNIPVSSTFSQQQQQQQQQLDHQHHHQFQHQNQINQSQSTIKNSLTNSHNHNNQQSAALPPIAQTTATNIMNHNSSLRSSIKLKQLEKSRNQHGNTHAISHMQPAINQAFELSEDDDGLTSTGPHMKSNGNHNNNLHENDIPHRFNNHVSQTNQLTYQANQNQQNQNQNQNQNKTDLCSIYNRLQNNLNGPLIDPSVEGKLAKLLSIYNTITQTRDKHPSIPNLSSRLHKVPSKTNGVQVPLVYKLSELLYSVVESLRNENPTEDIDELLNILYRHEFDCVCSSFDRIAQSFEYIKSKEPNPQTNHQQRNHQINPHQQENHQQNLRLEQQQNGFQQMHYNPQLQNQQMTNSNPVRNQTVSNNHNGGNHLGDYLGDYNNYDDNIQMDIDNSLFGGHGIPLTDVDLNEDDFTKTVEINKNMNQALGATIKNDGNRVIVGRIVCGGVAHKSGVLNEGDEILEVDGMPMRGKNINEVVEIMESIQGPLTLTIITAKYSKSSQTNLRERIFVRAFFDFDGENDDFIPCKDLGMSFRKGEILSIIDQSDEIWWQANREHDSDSRLAGLIPSLKHLKQRENHLSSHDSVPNYFNMKRKKKNLLSKILNCQKNPNQSRNKELNKMPFGPDQIPHYEEVHLYYPTKFRRRPIILVGPKMIGQREIVAKLLQDSSRFASAVSHTSRPRQEHERNGVDFHFVTRAQFEADMKAGKFIECGQYQNQYYGTSLEAMCEVVNSKKICVHLVNTPSIFNFRHGRAGSELKPFFVFVKPDDSHPEKLRNIVATYSQPKTNIDDNIRLILAEVQLIENHYLPYFDLIITVSNVDRAYQELLAEVDKIEKEPQWIPMFWQEAK